MEPFWVGVCIGAGELLVFQVITAWIFAKWLIQDEPDEPRRVPIVGPKCERGIPPKKPVTLSHEFGRVVYELHNQDKK